MSCGGKSVFGNQSQFIKFQGNDIIAVDGVNTFERLLAGDVRIPYKQLMKSRVILKPGQVNYLLNHLGLGDNATFLAIKATYNVASVNEEDNYVVWNYYDNFSNLYAMNQIMILTGNSTNRIAQLYLTNPNTKYSVVLDVMIASIDETYTFFPDTVNQTATTFTDLLYTNIGSLIVGESIVIRDSNSNPLVYMQLSNINSITRTSLFLTIDDSSLGTILLVFVDESNAAQAHSILNYALSYPSINIDSLSPDTSSPVVYWLSNVGVTGSYIEFDGATAGVPYDTSYGYTFSTNISLSDFPTLNTTTLIDLLVDYVEDDRDGIISLTASNFVITTESLNTITSITVSGTYSLTLDISDLALNNLDGVSLKLNIEP
jgi:hypothetical protein